MRVAVFMQADQSNSSLGRDSFVHGRMRETFRHAEVFTPARLAGPLLLVGLGLIALSALLLFEAVSRLPAAESESIARDCWGVAAATSLAFALAVLVVRSTLKRCRDLSEIAAVHSGSARELRARLEGVLGGANEGFWDWWIQSGDRWFSSRVYEMLGYASDTPWDEASDLREHVHPKDVKTFDEAMERRMRTGEFSSIEYRLRTRNGGYRWIRDHGRIVEWTDDGLPVRASGAMTDITEERRRRRELELNRELLQRAEAIARVGGWKWDITSNQLFWTEQVFRIHELPMTYRPDVDVALSFYDPPSRAELDRALALARDGGTPFDLELALTTANERNLWVRVIGEPDFVGDRIVGLHGTFQDISERKRFEMQLQESEQRYKLAIESSGAGIWDWNITSDKLVHNESWAAMLGHTSEVTVSSFDEWMQLVHPEDAPRVLAVLQAYLDDKTPHFESRHRMKAKSGEWKWILTHGKVVSRDTTGRPRRMTGTHKDVSFEKEVEDQLRAAHRAAEAATRAKTEFLANMSHEIRTPMTAILGFSENLLDDKLDEHERARSIQTIRRNGEHLLEIINDILDLSKIEAGRLSVERIRCSPIKIVHELKELLRVRAESKCLELTMELDGPVPTLIESDPTRFRQILFNIVGNAIKFTETGGVRIVLRFVHEDGVPRLQVDVIDTGIGMSKNELSRLFSPFTQADTTMTRRFGGTGLGLVISRRLAELLGGTIRVESERGKGSRFSITVEVGDVETIPFADSLNGVVCDASAAQAPKPVESLDARILIAEDGPDNQRLLTMMLRKVGASPIIAENGSEAIKLIDACRDSGKMFDVVLMDMQMPVLDGYQATRQLRASGFDRPIIALTAHSMRGDREKCLAAGCSDYMTKPIQRAELFECIRKHLASSAADSISA